MEIEKIASRQKKKKRKYIWNKRYIRNRRKANIDYLKNKYNEIPSNEVVS